MHHEKKLSPSFGIRRGAVLMYSRCRFPELVKQVGEMEKQHVISISKDSTVVFKGLEEEWQCKASLKNDTLYLEGTAFGVWKGGEIVTRTDSPLGEVVVTYRKSGLLRRTSSQ